MGRDRTGQKAEQFRGDGAYAVSGSVCLSGPLLCQQVFDGMLDPDPLVHSLREVLKKYNKIKKEKWW